MGQPLGSTEEFFQRRDEWRKLPRLTNQFRHALSGFDIGVGSFCVYLIGEQVYNRLYALLSSSHHSASASHSH